MARRKLTKESTLNEARKYETSMDFQNPDASACDMTAIKMGILEHVCTEHMICGYKRRYAHKHKPEQVEQRLAS